MANLSGLIAQNIIGAPVITAWQSFTPTIVGVTTSANTAKWRQVGDTVEVEGTFTCSGTSTATVTAGLPNSYTINTASLAAGGGTSDSLGTGIYSTSTIIVIYVTYGTANSVSFGGQGNAARYGSSVTLASPNAIIYHYTVPVNELSGLGVTSLGTNGVLFSSNSSSSTSASDTTSFSYGPAGQPILAVSSAGAWVKKRIQLPGAYLWSGNVRPRLMVSPDQKLWWPAVEQFPAAIVSGAYYGMELQFISGGSTNKVDVAFGGNGANSTQAWSAFSTWYWGVESAAPGQVTSFGLVQPGVASGLVPSTGLPGQTNGVTIPANTVGEIIKVTGTVTATTTLAQWATVSLTTGVWLLSGAASAQNQSASGTYLQLCIATAGGNSTAGATGGYDNFYAAINASQGTGEAVIPAKYVSISTTTSYFLNGRSDFAVSSGIAYFLQAVRIA